MGLLRKYNRHLIKRGYNGPNSFHAPFNLGQIITFSRRHGFTPIGNIGDKYFGIENYKPLLSRKLEQELDGDYANCERTNHYPAHCTN